eukprot:gnl/MRDRNA2_/MRDRNA2_98267_c0_seq1.p1 gnl/MRDRNA2_/MRDRNA2_98267_c0~~gnl/MRDRNA2_/MRDRNA2_98267_c0_seq1.p1  ORF type:complete len:408 (+),score=94.53 gnl/MRDRNA2_/MRDRNA2_98267_c0_seq1:160-1383(+)
MADVDTLTLGDPADDLADPEKREAQANWVTGLRLKKTGSTKAFGKKQERKKLVIEQIPEAGPKVIENRDENYQFASDFGAKVDVLLDAQANDFYLAFRVHMFNVMQKLREVKIKADKQEEKVQADPNIEYLEQRLAWFMTEALRLDAACKNLKKQVDEGHAKVESLARDCRLLSNQCKAGQRRNKVLWAASERARLGEKQALSHASMSKSRSAAALPAVGLTAPSSGSQSPLVKPTSNGSGGFNRSSSVGALPPLSQSLSTIHALKQQMDDASLKAAAGGDQQRWYTNTIKEMQLQLTQIQKETLALRASRGASLGNRSHMEELFLRSISEARQGLPRRLRERKGRDPSNEEKILETLLGSEQVLVTLYEGLFPHRAGIGHRFLSLKSEAIAAPPAGELYTTQQLRG